MEQETPFVNELDLVGAEGLLRRQRGHVHARPPFAEKLAQNGEVAVAPVDLKATAPVDADDRVLVIVTASGLMRIGYLEGLRFLHAGEAAFNLELSIDLTVLFARRLVTHHVLFVRPLHLLGLQRLPLCIGCLGACLVLALGLLLSRQLLDA